mgnify:CR=1 FL=1
MGRKKVKKVGGSGKRENSSGFRYSDSFIKYLENKEVPKRDPQNPLPYIEAIRKCLEENNPFDAPYPLSDHNALEGDIFVWNINIYRCSEYTKYVKLPNETYLDPRQNNAYLQTETPLQYALRCELISEEVLKAIKAGKPCALTEISDYLLEVIAKKAETAELPIDFKTQKGCYSQEYVIQLNQKFLKTPYYQPKMMLTQGVAIIRPISTFEIKLNDSRTEKLLTSKANEALAKMNSRRTEDAEKVSKVPEKMMSFLKDSVRKETLLKEREELKQWKNVMLDACLSGIQASSQENEILPDKDSLVNRISVSLQRTAEGAELLFAWHLPIPIALSNNVIRALKHGLLQQMANAVFTYSGSKADEAITKVTIAGDFNTSILPEILPLVSKDPSCYTDRIDAAVSFNENGEITDAAPVIQEHQNVKLMPGKLKEITYHTDVPRDRKAPGKGRSISIRINPEAVDKEYLDSESVAFCLSHFYSNKQRPLPLPLFEWMVDPARKAQDVREEGEYHLLLTNLYIGKADNSGTVSKRLREADKTYKLTYTDPDTKNILEITATVRLQGRGYLIRLTEGHCSLRAKHIVATASSFPVTATPATLFSPKGGNKKDAPTAKTSADGTPQAPIR